MTFWDWLYRVGPGWPTERQWVTAALVVTMWAMLQAAFNQPSLWNVKLFEILIQGFALTGFLSMVLAFYFSANKGDEARADNTGKGFDAIKAVAEATAPLADTTDINVAEVGGKPV